MESLTTNISSKPVSKYQKIIAYLWLLSFLLLVPELALANPISDGVDWVLDLLTNGIARSAAIVAIAILGYLAWAGRLTAEASFKFIGGIVLVFGGTAIVDLIIAAVA